MKWWRELRQRLTIRAITYCQRKSVPKTDLVPQSGESAKDNDFYALYLGDREGNYLMLIDELQENEVKGRPLVDGTNFEGKMSVPLTELQTSALIVHHYYKGWTFYSTGVSSFLAFRVLHRSFLTILIDRLRQRIFNDKQLPRRDRMKLLQFIFSETIKDENFVAYQTRLLTHFYSSRWIRRPDHKELQNYYDLLLESLKLSGDLAEAQHNGFRLTPKAVNTITDFEKEERRHSDNFKMQRRVVWLTIILLIVGIAQTVGGGVQAWMAYLTYIQAGLPKL